jgi:nitrogen fixation protein FixH
VRPYERTRANEMAAANVFGPRQGRPVTGRTVLLSLLGFFGVVAGINGVMMALAISTMPGTEVENPYRTGVGYNTEIGTAQVQAARHWRVASHVDRDSEGHATVKVEAHDRDGVPLANLAFTVRLVRPTDKRADRTVALIERERGSYLGEAHDVLAGVWDIELEAARGDERMFRSKSRLIFD